MSQPVRLGLVYAALFIGTGASAPYIPVWFAHRGLNGAEIGLILSAPMLARRVRGEQTGGGHPQCRHLLRRRRRQPARF